MLKEGVNKAEELTKPQFQEQAKNSKHPNKKY